LTTPQGDNRAVKNLCPQGPYRGKDEKAS